MATSDTPFSIGVPCFDLDDAKGLVDLIEEYCFKKKGPQKDCA